MGEQPRETNNIWKTIGLFSIGILTFLGIPEAGRLIHGGALAQQTFGGYYGSPNAVTGAEITGNNQGSPAMNLNVTGAPGQTTVGKDIRAMGCPGQNVMGLRVIQNGPGTGDGVRKAPRRTTSYRSRRMATCLMALPRDCRSPSTRAN